MLRYHLYKKKDRYKVIYKAETDMYLETKIFVNLSHYLKGLFQIEIFYIKCLLNFPKWFIIQWSWEIYYINGILFW